MEPESCASSIGRAAGWSRRGWPASLEPLRAGLGLGVPGDAGPQRLFGRVDERIPALVAPWWSMPPPGTGPRPSPEQGFAPPSPGGWLIVELDLDRIRTEVLPELVQRHFSRAGQLEYDVRVVSAVEPGRVIFASTSTLTSAAFDTADAQAALLQLRRGPLGGSPPGLSPGLPPGPAPACRPDPPAGRSAGPIPRYAAEPRGGWLLQVVHHGGSLDALVGQTRRRNLGVSFGVLAVLAVSLAVLLVSTRRAQRLATLQMDFVAGVSHELRTPLSVIRSAGENLADGLVSNGEQVRRYGGVVRDEGRRLSQMVEQILGFAGMQSGRMAYDFRPTEIPPVIARALSACEPEIRASGCVVETDVPEDLPMVAADATSLTHSLRNLLTNAATHGAEGGWVGVRARAVGAGRQQQVEIRVEDRGPGIDPRDARRLFDPFYRGRRSIERQVRGFGLGLTLARRIVDAHAGTLSAEPGPKGGACFIMRLPALPAGAQPTNGMVTAEKHDDGETDSARRG